MDAHRTERLLTDLIHVFTRMETKMAINFDALEAAITAIPAEVAAAVTALQPSADDAALQARIDAGLAVVTEQMSVLKAAVEALVGGPAPV
jgi:hypothetical protein